jgi:sugar lactone lactonase YvrE
MTMLTTVLTDLRFGESPRWHDGRLWLSDWGAGEVIAADLDGTREVVARPEGFPFSIDWLPDGRLLIVSSELRRMEADGSLVPHGDLSGLAEAWNELVVDGRGNAFVNQAGFDLMGGAPPTTGTVAVVRPDGSAREVADGVEFPNGMAVTPDDSTLILAESYGNRLTAFDISADGGLSNQRVWADLGDGVPDGICIDDEGAVWYADVPNRRCRRVREGGELLETIELDQGCFACMLGGAHHRTLFMVTTEWNGPAGMLEGPRTGMVLSTDAPAPHAGHP